MPDLFNNLEDFRRQQQLQPPPWPVACDWRPLIDAFLASPQGLDLLAFLNQRQQRGAIIFPPQPLAALLHTPLASVRVVILGQDPYHAAGQAQGLAFSVAQGVRIPPSLRNIFKERQRDLGIPVPPHGALHSWAAQGALLLNTTLSVESAQPASHAGKGWERLTDTLIQACALKAQPVVFMLWGAHAQSRRTLIEAYNADGRHLLLCANHPSPLSALRGPQPFIGCGHFGTARRWLSKTDAQATQLFV